MSGIIAHVNAPAKVSARPRHGWLYALPGGCLPEVIECQGGRYQRVETFKHDFFAATGLYRGPDGLIVVKLGRTNPLFCGLPLRWIGRFLARHEIRIYRLLHDLPGVPQYIGPVGETGFAHAFVPGHPLGRREPVSDTFFDELGRLLAAVHARQIAYVDLNKRQNILVGDDGRPYLIDFQIALHLPRAGWRGGSAAQWVLGRFQRADRYHLLKHKRRLRPDLLTPDERAEVERLSVWIRLHRLVARPLTHVRRAILRRLKAGAAEGVAGSSAK